jgi:hypothetical protein
VEVSQTSPTAQDHPDVANNESNHSGTSETRGSEENRREIDSNQEGTGTGNSINGHNETSQKSSPREEKDVENVDDEYVDDETLEEIEEALKEYKELVSHRNELNVSF